MEHTVEEILEPQFLDTSFYVKRNFPGNKSINWNNWQSFYVLFCDNANETWHGWYFNYCNWADSVNSIEYWIFIELITRVVCFPWIWREDQTHCSTCIFVRNMASALTSNHTTTTGSMKCWRKLSNFRNIETLCQNIGQFLFYFGSLQPFSLLNLLKRRTKTFWIRNN